ncbi:MAG TPA: FUSC family protein [Micromonosporaceae bacterium]
MRVRERAKPEAFNRIREIRMNFWLAIQAGLAAALSWIVAADIFRHDGPVFAPIVAVGTLVSSANRRLRSFIELLVGIVFGIAIGDLLIFVLGIGPWRLALVVVLAIVAATAFYSSGAVVLQAAHTSVLIVTLSPVTPNIEASRIIDGAAGALAALLVALVLPVNPLRLVNREVAPLMGTLAEAVEQTGRALQSGDVQKAREALSRVRELQDNLPAVHDAIDAGRETVTLSPLRWKRRAMVRQFVRGAEYLHRITINVKGMVRRAVTMVEDKEPVPKMLPDAFRLLAEALRVLHHELSRGLDPQASRIWTQRALHEVGRAQREGLELSGSVVVAQIRTISSDVLRASGLDESEEQANRVVRESVAGGASYPNGRRR